MVMNGFAGTSFTSDDTSCTRFKLVKYANEDSWLALNRFHVAVYIPKPPLELKNVVNRLCQHRMRIVKVAE